MTTDIKSKSLSSNIDRKTQEIKGIANDFSVMFVNKMLSGVYPQNNYSHLFVEEYPKIIASRLSIASVIERHIH